jgi:hypothetical protein
MTNTVLNRPWISSFQFDTYPYSDTRLDQFHKLCRNFIASLDLGCPSAKHVRRVKYKTEAAEYQAWVSDWKAIYKSLSATIRQQKEFRRTVRHPKLNNAKLELIATLNRGSNQEPIAIMQQLSRVHLERLQETAMAMLNARYNAKLAAGARRAKRLAEIDYASMGDLSHVVTRAAAA